MRPGTQLEPGRAVMELRSFEQVFASSVELRNALISPAIASARKKSVISRLAERLGLSRVMRNFLFVLVDNRRTAEVSPITESFEVLLDERLGFARGDVTSAQELAEQQRASLTAELSNISGKRLKLRFFVDPNLIGGVVARIGSTVYDGSIRGQLNALGQKLSAA